MTLYAAFEDGLLVDGEVRLTDVAVECVTAEGDTVLAGTFDDGLYRSTDGGETFSRALGDERVLAVARGHGEWWAGTEPSAVYRSTDGESWNRLPDLTTLPSSDEWLFPPRPHTHHVRWLEPGHEDGSWFVAIEAGALVRTVDGGETWIDRPPGARRDTHTLATHPDEPGRVYCAAGDGYAESTDGGDTWSYPQEGLDHRYCWSVAVAPSDPDVRVLSAARGARRAHSVGESYVYRNAGDGWARTDLPQGEGTYRYVLTATDEGIWALSNRGVFRSDAGDDWERVADVLVDDAPTGLAVTGAE